MDVAQYGLDVDHRRAIDRFQVAYPDRAALHSLDHGSMQADRIWAVGRAGCEHPGQGPVGILARMHGEYVAPGLVQPGQDEDRGAGAQPAQGRLQPGHDRDSRHRRPLIRLFRSVGTLLEGRFHPPDRCHVVLDIFHARSFLAAIAKVVSRHPACWPLACPEDRTGKMDLQAPRRRHQFPYHAGVGTRHGAKVEDTPMNDTAVPACIDTLVDLMALPAPTGQEEPVLAWCRERWATLGAEVEATPIGNVVARVGGSGLRLLLQGHADEISFVVRSIDDRGFVWLADGQGSNRSFHARYPVGQPALVLSRSGRIPGIFAAPTGHILSTRDDKGADLPDTASTIFVDVGVESREEAEAMGVHVGAGVIWKPVTQRLGSRYVGKAIDNRVSLALMTHLLMTVDTANLQYDLTLAATVQEEIGLVGAQSLATPDRYDLAIAIDNGPIADYPGTDEGDLPVHLGRGPTLIYKDAMVHYDRRVIGRLLEVATSYDIPVQHGVYPGFGSDGAALIRAGIPTALLAISTRYTHSPFEMGDERDLDGALRLLTAFVTTPAQPLAAGPS